MDLIEKLKQTQIGFNDTMLKIPEIQFLENCDIGLTINRAFAQLCKDQPKNPILFLGKWLEKEAKGKELRVKYIERDKRKAKLIENEMKRIKEIEQKEKIEQQMREKQEDHHNELKRYIKNCNNFWDNFSYICEELKSNVKATGAYLGIYDLKRKAVTEDDDCNGHIHPSNTKVLRYIAWCNDHKFLKNKFLENNTGVTYELIIPKVDIDPNQRQDNTNQDNQNNPNDQTPEITKAKKDLLSLPFKLIEDVIMEPNIKFFREPRLGSYIVIDITYKSSLKYSSLFSSIQCLNDYLEEKEKQDQRYKEWFEQREQIQMEIEELKKILYKEDDADFQTNKNDQGDKGNLILRDKSPKPTILQSPKHSVLSSPRHTDQSSTVLAEIQSLQMTLTEWKEEPVKIKEYSKEDKKLILALDTLGQDRMFTDAEIDYINEISLLIKDSITSLEQKLLEKDRDLKIQFDKRELLNRQIDGFNDETSETMMNIAVNEYYVSQEFKEKNITDETIKAIEGDCARLKFISLLLFQGGVYENLLAFEQFEFVKYSNIFQNLFYFVKTDPLIINEPGTNQLQWKLARNQWRSLFPKLKQYNPRGPKPEQLKSNYNLNKIKTNLETEMAKTEEVKEYSFSLYQLVDYVLFLIKIRQDDISQRYTYVAEKKEEREKIIQLNNEIEAEREKIIQQTNALLEQGTEQNEFNLEEVLEKHDQEHPKTIVPPEIDFDLDLDYNIKPG